MLIRVPSLKQRGVRRTGWGRWRAVDDDPQFVYAPRWLAAPYLIVDLSSDDCILDPRIYLDQGAGFEIGEEIQLNSTDRAIFAITLPGFGDVRRVRFDPSSFPSSFELRAFVAYDQASINAYVGRRLLDAAEEGLRAPRYEKIAAVGSSPSNSGGRKPKIRSAAKYYEYVIGMASARYSGVAPGEAKAPSLSFVCPVYNAPRHYLDQLWESFSIQRRGAWELILCDDGSTSEETRGWLRAHEGSDTLRIARNAQNLGIAGASNAALALAQNEWVAFIDHDDALSPYAVDRIVEAIERNPQAEFFYTDEVVANQDLEPQGYFFKPAPDPVLLSGVNYINHLSIYRRARLLELGGLREGFDGSQDYDLLLRYLSGVAPQRVLHIPYPAYLWRRDGKSFSAKFIERATANARRALSEAYSSGDAPIPIGPALEKNLHRVAFEKRDRVWPKISIVIPNRDSFELISRLLDNLQKLTDYPDFEVVVTDNGTTDPRVLDLYEKMRVSPLPFRAEILEEPFNFSRQVNRGLRLAAGEYCLLLNNDIEIVEPLWLKEMMACFDFPDVGVVGARLLYPDGRLQHVGVIVGLGSVAGHWYCGMPSEHPGPMGRFFVRQSLSAVTAACMLVSKRCLEATGPLDEEKFAIAYNDIDFCMRAGRRGFRVVWTPFATLRHHESASRGSDETQANIDRFSREKSALREKYGLLDYVDPAFSAYYDRGDGRGKLALPPELPGERIFKV